MTDEQEREWRAEAEVYRLLADSTIDELVATFRIVAKNPKLRKSERERARVLARLLKASKDPNRRTTRVRR